MICAHQIATFATILQESVETVLKVTSTMNRKILANPVLCTAWIALMLRLALVVMKGSMSISRTYVIIVKLTVCLVRLSLVTVNFAMKGLGKLRMGHVRHVLRIAQVAMQMTTAMSA